MAYFRQNKQPGSEFAAPDAVVTVAVRCSPLGVAATVRNLGEASLPPGVVVTYYEGSPPSGTVIGTGVTTKTLYSAQSEVVTLTFTDPMPQILNGTTPVYATVAAPAGVTECRPDNNTSAPVTAACGVPK
jgi:hypothetical protein